ncbi:hypothetical protein LTR29_014708 [Friedmanniomyces endolithicus]|nr:hypothetical protein LTR29_014708 [Friedmanniomyces endolithicus]
MAAREKGGRVVFIGNIPYGVSEEQICEIFGRVGSVVNFRLVYDKETQRPKGFGFLEYTDVDAAASAVRNLNDFEIMGRTLRVDYSNDNGGGKTGQRDGQREGGEGGSGRAPPPAHFNMNAPSQANGGDPAALPPLPPGQPLQDGLTAPDAISRTLQAIPAPQLLDIISQMKNMSTVNPAQATALLASAPQLGYAIFQALLLLGLVDTTILSSLVSQPGQAGPPQQQMPPQQPSPVQYQPQPSQQMPPQPLYAQPPPQYQMQPPQAYQQPPIQAYAPTPPVQQPAYQPPPPQQQAPLPGVAPDQQAIIQQIMGMSREHIFSLDEGPRGQILAIRAQFGAPVM